MTTKIEIVASPTIDDKKASFKYELRIIQNDNKVMIPVKMCSTPEDTLYKLMQYLDLDNTQIEMSVAADRIQCVPSVIYPQNSDKKLAIDPWHNPAVWYNISDNISTNNGVSEEFYTIKVE